MPIRTYTTTILGSTGIVIPGLNPIFSPQGSSAMGGVTISSTAFQRIEFSNGFAAQLNVAMGTTAAATAPGGIVTLQGSCDGINAFNIGGSSAIAFSSTGSFLIRDYPTPNFNFLKTSYTANSTSASSVYSVILTSKTLC